jgi:hypothetical protein
VTEASNSRNLIETQEHAGDLRTGEVLRDQTHRKLVNGAFQFQKCSQYFIGTNDETLSVAMRVNNPDRSAFNI